MVLVVFLSTMSAMATYKVKASPKTIRVPQDYSKIQEAINSASPEDTLHSEPYNESLVEVHKTIYIRANGSIDPPTAPIERVGDVYTLTDNITSDTDGIIIERNNMILDGKGYILKAIKAWELPNPDTRGVFLACRSNVTLKNIEIKGGFWAGILLDSSSENIIFGNTVTNNQGIRLENSSNNNIFENNITNNGYYGVDLYRNSSSNRVFENNITNNGYYGVSFGLYCNNNSIFGNNIANNPTGIRIYKSSGNSIYENDIIESSYRGVHIDYSSNNDVSRNNIKNNFDGIAISLSSNNSIIGNNITNNYYGVYIYCSSNNTIYYNNFVANTHQAYSQTSGYTNVWDGDYPSGGNYWSEYTDADLYSGPYQNETGSDGIWDHPYVIDTNNTDRYPLMNPWILTETMINIEILDGNKWHKANVPFKDTGEAVDFIDNFENNGNPPLVFGTLPLNIEVQNVGNEAAEKLVCNCTVTGVAIMIHLSDESIFKDNKTMYSFNYSTSKTIGTIYKGQSQNVTMNIPVEYMCVVAGPLTLDKGDEWVEPYTVDILFTIVELNVRVKISGSNCQPIEDQTRLYSVGNPYDLIDRMIDAAKQRVENAKEEALKRLLEMHIGVLATGVKTATFPAEVGQRRFIRTIDPGTTSLNVGVILSTGIKLTGLTVVIKEAISGLTSTLSITSSAVPGFAMICFTDVYKLLPKGKLSAEITLETESEAMAAGVAQVSQQDSNATLVMTNIIPPEYSEFSWKGSDYHVGIATNSTISGFKFNETIATISFNVTGIAGGTYFYKVSIPSEVIGENFNIQCDNNPIYDFKLAQNTTHSFLYFEYNFTKENYEIIIVPEFSQFLLLLFFFGLTTLVTLVVKRKKHNQNR